MVGLGGEGFFAAGFVTLEGPCTFFLLVFRLGRSATAVWAYVCRFVEKGTDRDWRVGSRWVGSDRSILPVDH